MPISGRRRNKVKGVQFTIMVVGMYTHRQLFRVYPRVMDPRLSDYLRSFISTLSLQVHRVLDALHS